MRQQVPEVFSGGDAVADLRAGDGQQRDLEAQDARAHLFREVVEPVMLVVVAGAVRGHDRAELGDLLVFRPGVHAHQRVDAGDEEELDRLVRVPVAHLAQRVHGMAGILAVDLEARDGELGIVERGQKRHHIALFGGSDGTVGFLIGIPGGDENDLLQGKSHERFLRRQQMAEMDGVEGSPHDADTQHRRLLSRHRHKALSGSKVNDASPMLTVSPVAAPASSSRSSTLNCRSKRCRRSGASSWLKS